MMQSGKITENTRADFLEIFVAAMPEGEVTVAEIKNDERRSELLEIRNEDVLREKYFVWRLLEYAVRRLFGRELESFSLRRTASGKWEAAGIEVSLSHSSGAVAVAVSSLPVGVDIERLVPPRAKNFAEKALSEGELREYLLLPEEQRDERIVELWSMKESLYKHRGGGEFIPRKVDTRNGVRAVRVTVGKEEFVLSFASKAADRASVHTDIEL